MFQDILFNIPSDLCKRDRTITKYSLKHFIVIYDRQGFNNEKTYMPFSDDILCKVYYQNDTGRDLL